MDIFSSNQNINPNPGQTIPQTPFDGLEALFERILDFNTSNESRDDILRSARNYDLDVIIIKICNDLNRTNYDKYGEFLMALLSSSSKEWNLSMGWSHGNNPVYISLNKVKKIPRAIEIPRIIIDYFIRMAKQKRTYLYVVPILDSLHELVKLRKMHTNLVCNTLRRLAFIPVENESIIIDQARFAHPLKFPWPIRSFNTRPIYECQWEENPVVFLQVVKAYGQPASSEIRGDTNQSDQDSLLPLIGDGQISECGTYSHSNQYDYDFSGNVFEVSYKLLWDISGDPVPTTTPQYWLRTLIYTFLFKCGIRARINVKRHEFDLEMLDNPAIIAFLEYRWNTIGHAYWLARFYFVCLYYVLVLGAIVVQVYGGIPRVSLFGVYIAIIAMASVSLMFKLFRIRRNRRCSPYDVIDIAVFTLPLAGSVTQIQNIMSMNEKGDISFLSFSVLVIFLHCLFELRIKRRICYFVTVILEIVGRIRLFFLLFALGIVAFALSILHFLRGCPVSDCGGMVDANFSKAPFRAISTTFLLLSGIWGSFGKSLDLEGRPAGFDLIMVFFVMLMAMVSLNILIALMNDGFKDAKDTSTAAWIQFKLSYVEEAESITYNIPGFREENAWRVPDVICYTATLQQQENYEKRFQKEDSEKRLEALRADLAEVRQMLSQVLIHAPSSA